jgi:hypothetical protein
MSDLFTSSSNRPVGAKAFLAKAMIFVGLFYASAMLASVLFARCVDWRTYQDPRDRLFWDSTSQTDVIVLGDSVFASSFVNSPRDSLASIVQEMTRRRVFNGALDGADPPDFLKAAQLLASNGTHGATVVLDVMPNRALTFRREELTAGNYPGRFQRVLGDNLVSRALVKLRQPLIILDTDILMNCLQKKQFYGIEPRRDRVWYRDGDMAHRRFQVFEQQVTFAPFQPFDWINDVDSILKHSGDRLVVFISPVNDDLIDTYASGENARKYHALYSAADARLIDYLQHAGIPYIDGTGQFDSNSFADMIHVNTRGERHFAELIAGYLQSNTSTQAKSASSTSSAQ